MPNVFSGITKKDLDSADMVLYAFIVGDEGLDGAVELNPDAVDFAKRMNARLYIPKVFERGSDLSQREKDEVWKEARQKTESELGRTGINDFSGLLMRKKFVKDGKILLGPIPNEVLKKTSREDQYSAAITLVELASHIYKNGFERLSSEKKEEILEDLEDRKIIYDRKRKRAEKKRS